MNQGGEDLEIKDMQFHLVSKIYTDIYLKPLDLIHAVKINRYKQVTSKILKSYYDSKYLFSYSFLLYLPFSYTLYT